MVQPANQQTFNGIDGGSPSDVYLFFMLKLANEYFLTVDVTDRKMLDSKTASLIAFVPDRKVREQIWQHYLDEKAAHPDQLLTASVTSIGMVIDFLCDTMDLTKKSFGGFC